MTGNDISGYLIRSTGDGSLEFRIADAAVQGISVEIMRGFGATRRRGTEVGGLLLGSAAKGRIAVDSFEIIPCEYAYGPSWLLSENDQAKLAEALTRLRSGAGPHKQVVGWFRSHTRDMPGPGAPDLETLHKHFSGSPAVLLLIRPYAARKPEAALHFADGSRIAPEPGITFTFSTDTASPSQSPADPAVTRPLKRERISHTSAADEPLVPQTAPAPSLEVTPVSEREPTSTNTTAGGTLLPPELLQTMLAPSAAPAAPEPPVSPATPVNNDELSFGETKTETRSAPEPPIPASAPAESALPVDEPARTSHAALAEDALLPPELQQPASATLGTSQHVAVRLPVRRTETRSVIVPAPPEDEGLLREAPRAAEMADSPPRASRDLFADYGSEPSWRFARVFSWLVFSLAAVLFGCTLGYQQAGGSLAALLPTGSAPPAGDAYALGLAATLRGDSVLVQWNRNAAVIEKALRGNLIVTSASGRHEIPLEPEEVRHGVVLYRTDAEEVNVRLEIFITPGRLIAEQTAWRRSSAKQQ